MTVSELIYELNQLQEAKGDVEVKIGIQPTYPLMANLVNVWSAEDGDYSEKIYLVAGTASEYFTSEAWDY